MTGPFTAILLAGGKSTRMGCDKAMLQLNGIPLLKWQSDKLHALGAAELLISGFAREEFGDVQFIPDLYPNCGPLSGLHACLKAADTPYCLVLSVDTPLVPLQTLRQLLAAHTGGVTVLHHADRTEPLIGVYDSALAQNIEPFLQTGGAPVRVLRQICPWTELEYDGPSELLCNCNTPDEFAKLPAIAALHE